LHGWRRARVAGQSWLPPDFDSAGVHRLLVRRAAALEQLRSWSAELRRLKAAKVASFNGPEEVTAAVEAVRAVEQVRQTPVCLSFGRVCLSASKICPEEL
jgi:hypothetical protein